MMTLQKELSHPGYTAEAIGQRAPSVKIGVLVACAQLGDTPNTSDLRDAFLRFLRRPPIWDLVYGLTYVSNDMSWHSYVSNGRLNNGAILAASQEQPEAPVASALLNLNESGTRMWGLDQRCAEILIHIQPKDVAGNPVSPLNLEQWFERLQLALEVPAAFASFLSVDVGVATSDDPPAQVGIRLDGFPNLDVLVDRGTFQLVPGSAITNSFPSYIVAAPDGKSSQHVAVETLRLWCDHALHIGGYEGELARLATTL
jgi:hypothetical protein